MKVFEFYSHQEVMTTCVIFCLL